MPKLLGFFAGELFLEEDVPRRLKRFRRKKGEGLAGVEIALPEREGPGKKKEINKQIVTQIALDEVQRFKEKHNRLPEKKEYDQIAESIYRQLRDEDKRKKLLERHEKRAGREQGKDGTSFREKMEERKGRRERRRGKPAEKPSSKESALSELKSAAQGISAEEIKGMSVKDLFGEAKAEKKAASEEDEFSLEGLSDMGAGQESLGEEEAACPNCGAREEVIFCPECGTAFCEKCARGIESIGNTKRVVCPKCGKKVRR